MKIMVIIKKKKKNELCQDQRYLVVTIQIQRSNLLLVDGKQI